jgi:hypothetical protein
MTLDEYQRSALRTARDNDALMSLAVLGLGIAGEAGEVADYIKKVVGHGHEMDPQREPLGGRYDERRQAARALSGWIQFRPQSEPEGIALLVFRRFLCWLWRHSYPPVTTSPTFFLECRRCGHVRRIRWIGGVGE